MSFCALWTAAAISSSMLPAILPEPEPVHAGLLTDRGADCATGHGRGGEHIRAVPGGYDARMTAAGPDGAPGAMVRTAGVRAGVEGADSISKGPYLQWVTQDAMTIMWETSSPGDSTVHYEVDGQWLLANEPGSRSIHEIRLTGFSPGQSVPYYVESNVNGQILTSDQYVFRTAPTPGTPVRLCLWGDNQDRPWIFSQHVQNMIADAPDLLLALGDVVSYGPDYDRWDDRFLGPLRPLINHVPMYAAKGNHEADAHWWYDFMALPNNERWYTFQYGDVFGLVLDTNYPFAVGSDQYQFAFDALLSPEAQAAKWLLVAHHHPPYSEIYEESIYAQIRRHLIPLYESAGVDVNFHGHIHDYERGEFVPPDTGRRVWQVQSSGGGGTLWWDEFDGEWDQIDLVIMDVYHYCVVDVTPDELTLRAIDLNGNIIDTFTIPAAPRDGHPPDDPPGSDPAPTQWDFLSGDLAASYGPGVVEYYDGPGGATASQTVFGSTTSLGLPAIAGQEAQVMGFPKAVASSMGLRVRHGTPPNSGGIYVNDYTLIFDLLIPQSSFDQDSWLPFHNTTAANANDADAFVYLDTGGIGISGQYDGQLLPGTWSRVAFVFDWNGSYEELVKYIDGVEVGRQNLGGLDGRWSLYTVDDATPWFFLFTDDSGDASTGYVSSVHYVDRAMSPDEVRALGGPDADGVMPEPIDCPPDYNGDGVLNSQDFIAFLNAFVAGDPSADYNADGQVNSQDFIAFLNDFVAGC